MTTNKTIDGVPRELLEDMLNPCADFATHERLRALLDADQRPEGCCCPPKGYTGLWAGAMCPIHFGLRAIKKAARPQGEPVAWIDWSGGDCPVDADAMVEYAMAGNPQQVCRPEVACRLDWRHDHRPTKRKSNIVKYRAVAEQPAPVVVK